MSNLASYKVSMWASIFFAVILILSFGYTIYELQVSINENIDDSIESIRDEMFKEMKKIDVVSLLKDQEAKIKGVEQKIVELKGKVTTAQNTANTANQEVDAVQATANDGVNRANKAQAAADKAQAAADKAANRKVVVTVEKEFDMNRSKHSCHDFGEAVLTTDPSNICAITGVSGKFEGGGERGRVFRKGKGWVFAGGSCQPDVRFRVVCIKVK